MNNFERSGEALLQQYEGNRIIAAAMARGVRTLAQRLTRVLLKALSHTPSPSSTP